jgi:hypothetical protein
VGHVTQTLYYRSEFSGFYLVEKKGENNGHGKTEYETINTEQSGITQKSEEIDAAEKTFEMLKPDPGTSSHPPERIEILKRDKSAVHGHIVENEIINNNRKEKKVQGYITSGKDFFSEIYHPIRFLLLRLASGLRFRRKAAWLILGPNRFSLSQRRRTVVK